MTFSLPFYICLPLGALTFWWSSFTFSPKSIHLLFMPFTDFFTISLHILYSIVHCSSQMFNPISSSLCFFFAVSHGDAGRIWEPSMPLSRPHSLFFPFQTVGSIKQNDILWKYHSSFFLWSVWALWPLQESLNILNCIVVVDTSHSLNQRLNPSKTILVPDFSDQISDKCHRAICQSIILMLILLKTTVAYQIGADGHGFLVNPVKYAALVM